ncbi:S-layer protein domain-containing protein [Methanolobus bombayensis]|uniref:S-layer protein domain-containing protein n=1 Tax=Methanolobus bombayensis TaxID=38023 RepID=UPI001AE141A8|nr:S-layer protein domain-containing protein [Methanolobus bombayensis]MBP1910052.1 S-layer protein (TIGR01567 family) [Methanolobus bombayensis]
MKRFTTIALVALIALAALVMPVTAVDSVEVRSSIFNGTDFEDIFGQQAGDGDIVINTTNFAGFWYDIDEDLASEEITIINDSTLVDYNGYTIEEEGLLYNATIVQNAYEADFADEDTTDDNTTFPLIGLFADKYVPTDDDDAGELVKLLLDTDDKYTLRTGSALELAGGYELTAKQIDVEGDKVWMELSKDGEFVEDEVVDLTGKDSATWDYDVDVGDQSDVIVFRVLITDVFQGQVDSLAVVEGLWLVDYENIMEVETSDEFGELEVDAVGKTISMFNSGTLTLSQDKTIDLAEGMKIQTADDANDLLRFYVLKEYTEPGTYEIRGSIALDDETTEWTTDNFAGFWYDLDDNEGSETLSITVAGRSVADEEGLWYNTTIVQTSYEADFADEDTTDDNTTFPIIGLFAQEYVSTDDDDAGELVKLLLDTDDKYTLRTGSALELAGGYELTAKQIDVEGDKVWMELSKDGEFVEDEVVDLSNKDSATWDYDVDVGDQSDVIVFRVLITDVFQGQVDSLAVVEGLWLLDYENVMEIETSDEFGELEVNAVGKTISMFNSNTLTLSKDKEIDLAEGMMLKTADNSTTLRYYPLVERTIGDEMAVEEPEEEEEVTEEDEMPTEGEEVTEEEMPAEEEEETPVEEEEEETTEEPAEEESPGFEAVFAVAGLLAVAYLVRRD